MTDRSTHDWAAATTQIHAGYSAGVPQNKAVVPIYQSTAYEFASFTDAAEIFALRKTGNLYSRTGNPTNAALEARIAALDGGVAALATGSGQSAVALALLALVRTGQHIVASSQLYGGSVDLLEDTFADFGITVSFVDPRDPDAWAAAVTEHTRAFFVESIGNPVASVPDLSALARVAHARDIPLVVDNTIATPYLLRPIDVGADIVVYSATKFLGGHGNSLAGVIVDGGSFDFGAHPERWTQFTTASARFGGIVFWEHFARDASAYLAYTKVKLSHDLGPALSPFNAFLILQGVETLDIRLQKQSDTAFDLARRLSAHPAVARVHHPSLPGHPDHERAAHYLPRGAGSVFAFDLDTGDTSTEPTSQGDDTDATIARVAAFIDSLSLFKLVANIGDVRSLVVHPATTTHSRLTPAQRAAAGFSLSTVRLSVGLESPVDLWADLEAALDAHAASSTSSFSDAVSASAVSTNPVSTSAVEAAR
ncbi:MAG: aminotransferase class I/II-fold pyridoxal phosphate-dependent enzyme [Glaciihabitans sp.]